MMKMKYIENNVWIRFRKTRRTTVPSTSWRGWRRGRGRGRGREGDSIEQSPSWHLLTEEDGERGLILISSWYSIASHLDLDLACHLDCFLSLQIWTCCSKDHQCGHGEGDCDSNQDCQEGSSSSSSSSCKFARSSIILHLSQKIQKRPSNCALLFNSLVHRSLLWEQQLQEAGLQPPKAKRNHGLLWTKYVCKCKCFSNDYFNKPWYDHQHQAIRAQLW